VANASPSPPTLYGSTYSPAETPLLLTIMLCRGGALRLARFVLSFTPVPCHGSTSCAPTMAPPCTYSGINNINSIWVAPVPILQQDQSVTFEDAGAEYILIAGDLSKILGRCFARAVLTVALVER
jgi:hypothetical protein